MSPRPPDRSALRAFLQSESAGGALLIFAAILAMIVANSSLGGLYHQVVHAVTGPTLAEQLGPMTVPLWINAGLLAVFLLLVGLGLKHTFGAGLRAIWERRACNLHAG